MRACRRRFRSGSILSLMASHQHRNWSDCPWARAAVFAPSLSSREGCSFKLDRQQPPKQDCTAFIGGIRRPAELSFLQILQKPLRRASTRNRKPYFRWRRAHPDFVCLCFPMAEKRERRARSLCQRQIQQRQNRPNLQYCPVGECCAPAGLMFINAASLRSL
jgi:hypothetical protein